MLYDAQVDELLRCKLEDFLPVKNEIYQTKESCRNRTHTLPKNTTLNDE